MIKKMGWALLALTMIVWLCAINATPIVKTYVAGHYPGVVVQGPVHVGLHTITLTSVTVDRPGVHGTLAVVTVDFSKKVHVDGGVIEITLNDTAHEKGSESADISGEHLKATVRKGDTSVDTPSLSFDTQEVYFLMGTAHVRGTPIDVDGFRLDRLTKKITVDSASVVVPLPFDIPKLDSTQEISLRGLEADPEAKILTFEEAKLGTFVSVKGRSTVKLTDDDVLVDLAATSVDHPWISLDLVTFPTIGLVIPRSVFKTRAGSVRVTVGPATVRIDPATYHIEGDEECNTWVQALPSPIPDALKTAAGHFHGRLSFEVRTVPVPSLNIKNSCKLECSSELITSLKGGHFEYKAYRMDNTLFTRTLGPFNKDWIPLATLPPNIPKAFVTLEDPGFESHNGIIPQALENSLKANLKLGRFFRGGSTISMQLAKNIWLQRSKTLGRKAEEALLTIALESCLTKAEILEFYLNAVEFGPNLYGIGPAAQHYFHKPAAALEPDEAFYLASLMPHPRTALPPTPGVMAGVRKLMGVLAERGYISDQIIPLQDSQVDSTGWEAE
jgi:hypothetical protein